MNLEYKHLLPAEFSPESRVWIYQSNRRFAIPEALKIEEDLKEFVKQWHSHQDPVRGYAGLFFGQFIVLIADETRSGVSGCSTDSSVRLIKKFEQDFKVSLFDRQLLAFLFKDKVDLLPLSQVPFALENGLLKPDSLYFNNLVTSKEELEKNWIIPIENSWLAKRFALKAKV